MQRLLGAIKGIVQGLVKAVSRFPLTVIALVIAPVWCGIYDFSGQESGSLHSEAFVYLFAGSFFGCCCSVQL